MPKQLILCSTSPARRELLSRLQIPFEIMAPDIDETPLPNEDALALVKRLALTKAAVAIKHYPDALIIGADQVGILGDDPAIIGKPLTEENAFAYLKSASGKCMHFFTGICLLDAKTKKVQEATETYDVYFRSLQDEEIKNYLAKEKPLHCAGSFHAEGLGITLIEKFSGEDFTALIGLPLIRLAKMLRKVNLL